MIHMLTVSDTKKEFKMGRGHESEVRVHDISVSRCHAFLRYQDDGFYLEDNISKFGSLILMKESLVIELD